jgi:geranylgeranyl diphosphate synthase, type I
MSFANSLTEYSKEVHLTLEDFFKRQEVQAKEIDTTLVDSLAVLREFSLRGGKAVRPYLVSLAYSMAGGASNPELIKVASAIDLHHKHLLILDDIADRDQERYGGPTVEWAYKKIFSKIKDADHRSRTFAMMDGVWLGALSKELLLESSFEPSKLLDCLKILNTIMFRDTLAGWQIHGLECDKKISQVTPEEFTKGLELVTARYTFEGPFKIGLKLAGNQDLKLESALTEYSQKVGTAFQIHDDILGLFGDSEKTGKPVGNDVREGKKTLLIQYAYTHSERKTQEFLESVVGNAGISPEEINKVQEIVKVSGALEDSVKIEKKMIDEGVRALSSLPDSSEKRILIELAHFVIQRDR